MLNHLKQHFGSRRTGGHGGLDIARHIGPGLLVTVGFIDPGNWASNMGNRTEPVDTVSVPEDCKEKDVSGFRFPSDP